MTSSLSGAQGKKAKELVEDFYKSQQGRCLYCACITHTNPTPKNTKATFEHLTPRARGGRTTRENGGMSCKRCNNLKQDNTHEEFLSYIRACGSVEAYAALLDRAGQYLEGMRKERRQAQLEARKNMTEEERKLDDYGVIVGSIPTGTTRWKRLGHSSRCLALK